MPEISPITTLNAVQTCASNRRDAGLSEKTTTLNPVRTGTRATREPRLLAALRTIAIEEPPRKGTRPGQWYGEWACLYGTTRLPQAGITTSAARVGQTNSLRFSKTE